MEITLKSILDKDLMPIFFRITPSDVTIEYKTLFEQLKKYKHNVKMILAKEVSNKGVFHYHVFMCVHKEVEERNAREKLRRYLVKTLEINGNQNYAISKCQVGTEQSIAAYTVKDGDFLYYGFTEEEIATVQRVSFKKLKDGEYKTEFARIRSAFLAGKIYSEKTQRKDVEDNLVRPVNRLRMQYMLPSNYNNTCAQLRTIVHKKYENIAIQYEQKITDEIVPFRFES